MWHNAPSIPNASICRTGYHRYQLGSSLALTHLGQNQGAGVFTGLGLRRRHFAHKKRLPFTAVFGRNCFPLRGKFFVIETSNCNTAQKRNFSLPQVEF